MDTLKLKIAHIFWNFLVVSTRGRQRNPNLNPNLNLKILKIDLNLKRLGLGPRYHEIGIPMPTPGKYHSCPHCETKAVKDTFASDSEKINILEKYGSVIIERECIWKQKAKFLRLKSPYSLFFYRKEIKSTEILQVKQFF